MSNTATATKPAAAKKALKATDILTQLKGKGYTPVQVVNSLQRKVAHVEKTVTNPVVAGAYKKALVLAEKDLEQAHKDGFVPCVAECMTSAHKSCECHCSGKNHGVNLKAAS